MSPIHCRLAASFLLLFYACPVSVFAAGEFDRIYTEIVLEDFETGDYGPTQITAAPAIGESEIRVMVLAASPAPAGDSRRYLTIQLTNPPGRTLLYRPARRITVESYLNEVTLWYFGFNRRDVLELSLADRYGFLHTLRSPALNFAGWRKISFPVGARIAQMDPTPSAANRLELTGLTLIPGKVSATSGSFTWQMDEIRAIIRPKYLDKK